MEPVTIADLVFVGFNSRVAALRRSNGELVWQWVSPKGGGFVALLVDRYGLVASVKGYTYAIDPLTGETLWQNPLPGFGTGVPCLASIAGSTAGFSTLAELEEEARRRQNAQAGGA